MNTVGIEAKKRRKPHDITKARKINIGETVISMKTQLNRKVLVGKIRVVAIQFADNLRNLNLERRKVDINIEVRT